MKSSLLRSMAVWSFTVAALALANYAAGRLCLIWAVPPGYATPAFAPAGIALAAVLLFGYRVWPGVLLGAFAINQSMSFWELSAVPVSLSIAAGSAMQAVVGAWSIRRWVGFPTSLDDETSILKFLGLGGPVSCVLAATWGTVTLSMAGIVSEEVLYNWFAWWAGDSVGVIVFAPLLLIAFGNPREIWRTRRYFVGIPVILAFVLVVWLSYYAKSHAEAETQLKFTRRTDTIHSAVASTIESYSETVRSIAGLYHSSEHVNRFEFHLFVERALTRQPGIAALGWIPRVEADERQQLENEAHLDALKESDPKTREGLASYRLKKWHPGDDWIPYDDDQAVEYFPVHYIEPYQGNERALGIDLGSNPQRRTAIDASRDLDELVATAPIVLAQESDHRYAVLLIAPIWTNRLPAAKVERRQGDVLGFASGVVRVRDIVEASCSDSDLAMIELSILDESVPSPEQRQLYGKLPEEIASALSREQLRLQRQIDLEIGGRTWQLQFTPSKRFLSVSRGRQLWGEMAVGFLFTIAISGSTLLITGRNRLIEKEVEQRTDELRLARFAMDHAADSVFWVNDKGRFHDVNRTACERLGYTFDELTSMSVWDIDPDYPREHWGENRAMLSKAGRMIIESRHQTKNGRIYPVEISTGYMDFWGDGYLCAIARDITERKEAIEALQEDEQLLRQLLDTQEKERRMVAHDIHDGFVQYVFGAHFQLQGINSDEDPSGAAAKLEIVDGLLQKAISEGRRLIRDLRPLVLDESGVIEALRHLIADEHSAAGLVVEFEHEVQFDRLEPKLEGIIFRIIQEALNNVVQHGQTNQATVRLNQKDQLLEVVIRDQGAGFDPREVSIECFGLRGIRERARLFGGTAVIESAPGDGTVVYVQLPVDDQWTPDATDPQG